MMTNTSVLARLTALEHYSMTELKTEYETLTGEPCHLRNRNAILAQLSYRIQELAYGGLSAATQTQLKQLAQRVESGPIAPVSAELPPIGTELIRKYKGVDYHVTVKAQGFEFQGQVYASLSKVAKVITGTNWNGLVFFGLKKA